jgi:hypothetical protein
MSKIAMTDEERKEHQRERDRRRYLRNREAILARMAAYDAIPEHKAKRAAYDAIPEHKAQKAAYYVANREALLAYQAARRKTPAGKAQHAAYSKTPAGKAKLAAYRKTPAGKAVARRANAAFLKTPAGKAVIRRQHAKRREMDFEPLNSPFPGSDGHHINVTDVIFIPKAMHKSIWHNHFTGKGMEQINALAYEYLALDPSFMADLEDLQQVAV